MLRVWLGLIGAAALALFSSSAWATDETQAFGDHGDADYHDYCAAGSYMVGVRVSSGLWMDQVTVACATPRAGGSLANAVFLTPHGVSTPPTKGSPPYERYCPAGSVINGIDVATLDNRRVTALKFTCRPTMSTGPTSTFTTANSQHPVGFGNPPRQRYCPANEAAVGLHGGYGKDVNSAGLICGPLTVSQGQQPRPTSPGGASPLQPGSTSSAAPYNSKVLEFARTHLGQTLGAGQCTDLVIGALAYAGAKPGDTSSSAGYYVWGRVLNIWMEAPQPGDIVQLVGVNLRWDGPNGAYQTLSTPSQHSAIIESVTNGKTLNVIQQNSPTGAPVQRGVIDFNWKLLSGSYKIFRPISH